MSNAQVSVNGDGIGFGSLLALLFIGLKLGGVISWSWWWVLAPIWIPIALFMFFAVIVLIVALSKRDKRY